MSDVILTRTIDELAHAVAALTGETVTEAIQNALAERLARAQQNRVQARDLLTKMREIADHFAALPDFDTRSADEIIGYDENGMW